MTLYSNYTDNNINVDLKFNLYLTNYHLRNLWRPFQQIILSLNSSDSISPEECERLIKVKDCIDLIKKKAFVSK